MFTIAITTIAKLKSAKRTLAVQERRSQALLSGVVVVVVIVTVYTSNIIMFEFIAMLCLATRLVASSVTRHCRRSFIIIGVVTYYFPSSLFICGAAGDWTRLKFKTRPLNSSDILKYIGVKSFIEIVSLSNNNGVQKKKTKFNWKRMTVI